MAGDQQKLKAENHHPLIHPLPMTHLPQAVRMMTSTKGGRRARKRNPLLLLLGVKERRINTGGRKRKKKKINTAGIQAHPNFQEMSLH